MSMIGLVSMAAVLTVASAQSAPVGYFFGGLNVSRFNGDAPSQLPASLQWLAGSSHYRLVPAEFPKGIDYHFDGLAVVLKFSFKASSAVAEDAVEGTKSSTGTTASWVAKPYASNAFKHWESCIFFASGSGPTPGIRPCIENPVVNMLPINGQLWLTIDTNAWGRIDPDTLETIEARAKVDSVTLNAHPACDRATNECFVQHPCAKTKDFPITDQACFSRLVTGGNTTADISVVTLTQATLPAKKTIQHSHSPCITPNYVVAKIDSFGAYHNTHKGDWGMLNKYRQMEDNVWLVMDRRTNASRVLRSNLSFVNNHFWNCFESPQGIVVDAVPATEDYLSTYYRERMHANAVPNWRDIFYDASRCIVPFTGNSTGIACHPLMVDRSLFDYPTFNALYKMNPDYQWFYAISIRNETSSRWFDRLIKVNTKTGLVDKEWFADGVYLTEADFVPKPDGAAEDDGALMTVLYNATSNTSSFAIFNAMDLTLQAQLPLASVVPFHAHGVSCVPEHGCLTNP